MNLHILALGQSNVANHGSSPGEAGGGAVWKDGHRHPLKDPIPGGSGKEGSVWTRFGPRALSSSEVDDFVLSLRAAGGSSIEDWSAGGICCDLLLSDLPDIRSCDVPVTHIVFHQGERDTLLETTDKDYVERFRSLHELLRTHFPDAPILVCRVSYRMGVCSEAVRRGQRRIVDELEGCRQGPDTDRLGSDMRFDNTHFNEAGLDAFAKDLWASIRPLILS